MDRFEIITRLERRVADLEANVRRLRTVAGLAGGILVAVLAMGASPGVHVPDTLSAARFQLVGADGRIVGVWEPSSPSAMRLATLDSRGGVSAGIELAEGKPAASIVPATAAERDAVAAPKVEESKKRGANEKDEHGEEEDDAFDWVQ